jgi:hypothetical protein
MRLPRLTVRRLMIAVAITTILLWYAKHWIRYKVLASRCLERSMLHVTSLEIQPNGVRSFRGTDIFFRLVRKADEYDFAKWQPWLSVEPDPADRSLLDEGIRGQ